MAEQSPVAEAAAEEVEDSEEEAEVKVDPEQHRPMNLNLLHITIDSPKLKHMQL